MAGATQSDEIQRDRIILGLLESVERDGSQSQRRLAAELGIALGLVNAYLKRCISKGLLKVNEVPARRYAYYLTPQGFAEKSRLTVEYLSSSFNFFRRAKAGCMQVFEIARERNCKRLVLAGISDLAEIAAICALDGGFDVVAVVDPRSPQRRFVNLPVAPSLDAIGSDFDAVIVTDVTSARETADRCIKELGADRVLIPALLGLRLSKPEAAR